MLLRLLLTTLGTGRVSLFIIQSFYALLLLAFAASAMALLRELVDRRIALRSTVVLLLLPVTTYLGFKTLSEVPSVLLSTLGCWGFVRSFREPSGRGRRRWLALAVAGLALGGLSRVTGVMEFIGLTLGLLAMKDRRFPPGEVLRRAALAAGASLCLYGLILSSVGGSAFGLLRLAYHVATHDVWLQRIYALLLALQAFILVLPFGLRTRNPQLMRLALVWLSVAALPFVAGHESRYYASALIPLAVLSSIGVSRVAERIFGRERRWAWIGVLSALVLVNRVVFAPLMPYEVDQASLNRVMMDLERTAPGGTYLVPWISDYAYLRIAFPDQPVRLALSAIPGSRYTAQGRTGEMAPEDRWWAGPERYVGSWPQLRRESRPWYYVGWDYAPPLLKLRQTLAMLGVQWAYSPEKAGWHNHLAGSWIWGNDRLSLMPAGHEGQYQIFRIEPVTQTSPGSSPPAPQ